MMIRKLSPARSKPGEHEFMAGTDDELVIRSQAIQRSHIVSDWVCLGGAAKAQTGIDGGKHMVTGEDHVIVAVHQADVSACVPWGQDNVNLPTGDRQEIAFLQ